VLFRVAADLGQAALAESGVPGPWLVEPRCVGQAKCMRHARRRLKTLPPEDYSALFDGAERKSDSNRMQLKPKPRPQR